ncbi:MAG: hypothetical protein L0Y38_09145 [Methylococcaceae bacterium]|nr:hypothetical protein [Methylococcaceae bacterium]
MQAYNPRTDRRGFLLGMTLNELVFMLFFLLVLIGAHLLEARNKEIAVQSARLAQLQQKLLQQKSNLNEAFSKLGAVKDTFDRLQELQPRIAPGELAEQFKRLVESESKARTDNEHLRNLLTQLFHAAGQSNTQESEPPAEALRRVLARQTTIEAQNKELESRIKTLHARTGGSGLDHLPCWIDPESGEIEYLYRVILLENRLKIEAAWPASRDGEAEKLMSLRVLANRTVSAAEFSRLAGPILAWSRRQKPECRHFVRIQDHEATTKTAFKKHLRLIETFFYKYLEPDKS